MRKYMFSLADGGAITVEANSHEEALAKAQPEIDRWRASHKYQPKMLPPRNCSTCKHWNRDEPGFPYVTGLELHPCKRIPHGDDVTEFHDDDYSQEYLKQEFAGTLAFANDASGYSAHLATAAGFSCAHWERVEQ